MIHTATLDNCLRRLDQLANGTYRKDFRDTASLARRVIVDLCKAPDEAGARLGAIANRISERAAVKPQLVYRSKRSGTIHWISADAASAARIPHEQRVGIYDAGNDWRQVLADLLA